MSWEVTSGPLMKLTGFPAKKTGSSEEGDSRPSGNDQV